MKLNEKFITAFIFVSMLNCSVSVLHPSPTNPVGRAGSFLTAALEFRVFPSHLSLLIRTMNILLNC